MPKNKKDETESSSDSEAERKSSKKTKRESKKKDDSDSDSGPDDRNQKKKKGGVSSAKKSSSDDDNKWSIGKSRFAALREFKGTWYVDIREYYNADGDLRPGKKGIMLQMEQWQKLKKCIPDIDDAIKQNV